MRVELQAELLQKKKAIQVRAEEALEAVGRVSPTTHRPYPLTMVCETWGVARSSLYALRARLGGPPEPDRQRPGQRGPQTALSDEALLQEVQTVLKASPFLGEHHRRGLRPAGSGSARTGC